MINLYRKNANEILSDHFHSTEFDCPCNECFITMIDQELIFSLEDLRVSLDTGIHINSGYRCEKYQQALRERGFDTAKGVSTHQVGAAVDIWTGKHSGLEIEKAAREVGFRSVGVADKWVHLDLRRDKDRRWTY